MSISAALRCQRRVAVLVAAILLVALAACRHSHVAPQASASKARRKAVNVVMVVDRSGSLSVSGSCTPLSVATLYFANQFTPGRDKLGVVTFATTTYVDLPITSTFQTTNPNITDILTNINCAGATSSAQALWTGYQQLLRLNQADAVNVILFFTDGNPSGATFDMPVAASSPCGEYTPGSPQGPGGYSMPPIGKGYLRGVYSSYTNVSQFFGMLDQNGEAGPNGLMSPSAGDFRPAAHSTGCAFSLGWPQSVTNTSDFLGVPTKDVFGNSANTTYQPVTLNSAGFIDTAKPSNAQAVPLNVADSAAANIRNEVSDPAFGHGLPNVMIYSVGLVNAPYPVSPAFLERVSNDPRSPIYDSSKPAGQFISAASGADLQPAFSAVVSQIFRLSQ
jgi:hypothetical protein